MPEDDALLGPEEEVEPDTCCLWSLLDKLLGSWRRKKQSTSLLRLSTQLLRSHSNLSPCGASTIAIDNKIEQAMDLVKSHLMFAVREEVEVLKDQIKELLEKNTQLEYENTVLRNAASPETLAKLKNNNKSQPSAPES